MRQTGITRSRRLSSPDSDDDGGGRVGPPYAEHTVVELRGELRRRDLTVSGRKSELVERLEDDDGR